MQASSTFANLDDSLFVVHFPVIRVFHEWNILATSGKKTIENLLFREILYLQIRRIKFLLAL